MYNRNKVISGSRESEGIYYFSKLQINLKKILSTKDDKLYPKAVDFSKLLEKINERLHHSSYKHLALYRQRKMTKTQRDNVGAKRNSYHIKELLTICHDDNIFTWEQLDSILIDKDKYDLILCPYVFEHDMKNDGISYEYIPSYWKYLLDVEGDWYYPDKEDPRVVDESVSGKKRKGEDSSSD